MSLVSSASWAGRVSTRPRFVAGGWLLLLFVTSTILTTLTTDLKKVISALEREWEPVSWRRSAVCCARRRVQFSRPSQVGWLPSCLDREYVKASADLARQAGTVEG